MRRLGRPFPMLLLLTLGLGLATEPRLAHAVGPVIAVPASAELLPRNTLPLASFRMPEPFLTATKRTAPNDGVSNLKWFLSDRSPFDTPPTRVPALKIAAGPRSQRARSEGFQEESEPAIVPLPAVGLTLEPAAETLPIPALGATKTQEMPADVAEAVKMLLRKDAPRLPTSAADNTPIPKSPTNLPPAVASAVKLLGNPATKAAPPRTIAELADDRPDPNRTSKLAAVNKAIDELNKSIVKDTPAAKPMGETPPLINVPYAPIPGAASEDQDATKAAIAKAAAQVLGQLPEPPQTLPAMIPIVETPPPVVPTSCATCGRNLGIRDALHDLKHTSDSIGGCASCGGGWRCAPGHKPCEPCEAHDGPLGRLFCDFYECLCCPDPCYEPTWRQIPNAALFVDGARPVTQTEVRWNGFRNGHFPDRSEYLFARADGKGRGPMVLAGRLPGGPINYDDLILITETAKDKLSAIIEMPYRAVSPYSYAHGAGFGDMAIGTKTLLFDCELLQVSLQMKTYLPIGNAFKGVGTGHVSLEPSLLFALKLHKECYLQGQVSEWIPIGGDPAYMGSILHSHFSCNHVIHRFGPDIPVVGTMELNTYSFQDGAYTDPVLGAFQKSSGTTYVSAGPGIRLFFCDKLDIGFGAALSLTGDHFARQMYRTSVRFRF